MSGWIKSIRSKDLFVVVALCAIAALVLAFVFGRPPDQMKAVIAALVVLLIGSVVAYMVKK
jgi:multisubunit Na+/H+ antiporter MnhG subunit